MKRAHMIIWGILLIALGAVMVLIQMGWIQWNSSWWLPALFLGLAIFFHVGYFLGGMREHGLLVPGGIFLTYGVLLAVSAALGDEWLWRLMGLWVAGPAVGIGEMTLASRGRDGSWTAVGILASISLILLLVRNTRATFAGIAGVVLVVWGTALILHEVFRKRGIGK
jgi:hypothetical protein